MDPSSLVFAAIIGVWAAYLVPAWLRRRVQMAESRSRDRFSSGVRVLNRRRRARRDGLMHRSSGAVLTAPRESSGFVRLEAAEPAEPAEPVVEHLLRTPSADRTDRAPSAPATPSVPRVPSAPERAPGEAARARARAALREAQAMHQAAVQRARLAAARRFRALIALLLVVAAAWTLSMATAFRAWIGLTATGLLVLDLAAGRVAAIRSKQVLDESRQRVVAARRLVDEALSAGVAEATAVVSATDVAPAASSVAASSARPEAGVGDTWVPVPVPPPTYTLKPAVHRPEPAPLPSPLPSTAGPAASGASGASTGSAASAAGVDESGAAGVAASSDGSRARGRGALPRRAEEIERILDLDALEQRTAVNG
jgi:hypothetical protein